MRRLALLCSVLGCAEWRMPATFPEQAAGRPIVHEQALIGFGRDGTAAAAEFLEAEGDPPRLTLLALRRDGPTRTILEAPPERANAVAARLHAAAERAEPALRGAIAVEWPSALSRATELGFAQRSAATPDPGQALWQVKGAPDAGALPLTVRVSRAGDAMVLLLSDSGDDAELARMPLTGAPVGPQLFLEDGMAWLLAGSVRAGPPLRRMVGIRRASLRRGEAELHNAHGLADYGAGELDSARREFDRAIAADPGYVDGLYNAAATAALSDRSEEAVAFLRRAAAVDPSRVQVLGRNDDDLKSLRRRADVRALLGLRRPPPEGVPPPP
jgi:tetratricopeptide (TPR) repeat protein